MRNKYLLSIFILLTFFNCKKDDDAKPWGWGNADLTVNNVPWKGQDYTIRLIGAKAEVVDGISCNLQVGSVNIHKYLKDQYLRERIYITKIPFKTGNYAIGDI